MTAQILAHTCAKCGKRSARELCISCNSMCAHCHKREPTRGSVCERCRRIHAGKVELRRLTGLCIHCGDRESDPDYKSCQPCRDYFNGRYSTYRRLRRVRGLCLRCDNKSYGTLCDSCSRRSAVAQTRPSKYRLVESAIMEFLATHGESEAYSVLAYLDNKNLLEDAPPSIGKRGLVSQRLSELRKAGMVSRTGRLWRIEKGD